MENMEGLFPEIDTHRQEKLRRIASYEAIAAEIAVSLVMAENNKNIQVDELKREQNGVRFQIQYLKHELGVGDETEIAPGPDFAYELDLVSEAERLELV